MPAETVIDWNFKPINYREYSFHLFGEYISIAGLAGPHNNKYDDGSSRVNEVFEFLYQNDRLVSIGLHEVNEFKSIENDYGMQFYHVALPDFAKTPLSPQFYDLIYEKIKEATEERLQVSIHCGSGNGRTTTALASLKLREILEEAAFKAPAILNRKSQATETIGVVSPLPEKVKCTPFVKKAILALHQARLEAGPADSVLIETSNDVRTLMRYEEHLKGVIKNELDAEDKQEGRKAMKLIS